MSDIIKKFEDKINRLFSNDELVKQMILDSDYLSDFLELDDNIELDDLISFISNYEDNIINNLLVNETFKDKLLTENGVIYRTKESKINKRYLQSLFEKLKNKKFNFEVAVFMLEIIKFINLYGINRNQEYIKNILDNKINIIVNNVSLASDGDTLLSKSEKLDRTNILLNWNEKCEDGIIENIFLLELLKERLEKLYNSDRLELEAYKSKLSDLLNTCLLAISIRDNDVLPSIEDKKKINSLFSDYEKINKELMINLLNCHEYILIHFVQTNEVEYEIIDNQVINCNEKGNDEESTFNNEQNNCFINSYIENCIGNIEIELNEKFDINNQIHKNMLRKYLVYFNNIFNYKPLTRIPMNICETNNGFRKCIRQSDNRLSCSFNSLNCINPHLNRSVGLIVKPLIPSAIISMSYGYTSKKYFSDFRNDSVTCLDLIEILDKHICVSEIVLDTSYCQVVGVVLLDENENSLLRAEHLSKSYGVPIIDNYQFGVGKKI